MRWLTEVAGLDAAIDYKQGNLDEQIAQPAPTKWDVFFDNVSGTSGPQPPQSLFPCCHVRRYLWL